MTLDADKFLQTHWQEWLSRFTGGNLLDFIPVPASHDLRVFATRYMAMHFSHAYLMAFHCDPDHPEFLPHTGEVFNLGAPNPDAVYYFASLTSAGLYRISGIRNTVRYVDLQTGHAMWGFPGSPGKTFPSVSLDDFAFETDGSFEILLGTHKPDGYQGNWLQIDPTVDYILVRQFAYSWREMDARMAIERLDTVAPQRAMSADETETKLQWLADYFNNNLLVYPRMLRRAAGERINSAATVGFGVAELARQTYQEGTWSLRPDEVLLCEVRIPEPCFYWNIQASDLF